MNPQTQLGWLRSRLRVDERGVIARDTLLAVLVVLAIVAVVLWIVTSFSVTKK